MSLQNRLHFTITFCRNSSKLILSSKYLETQENRVSKFSMDVSCFQKSTNIGSFSSCCPNCICSIDRIFKTRLYRSRFHSFYNHTLKNEEFSIKNEFIILAPVPQAGRAGKKKETDRVASGCLWIIIATNGNRTRKRK